MNINLIILIVTLLVLFLVLFISDIIYEVKIKTILRSYESYKNSDEMVRAIINCLLLDEQLYELQYKVDKLDERDLDEENKGSEPIEVVAEVNYKEK